MHQRHIQLLQTVGCDVADSNIHAYNQYKTYVDVGTAARQHLAIHGM